MLKINSIRTLITKQMLTANTSIRRMRRNQMLKASMDNKIKYNHKLILQLKLKIMTSKIINKRMMDLRLALPKNSNCLSLKVQQARSLSNKNIVMTLMILMNITLLKPLFNFQNHTTESYSTQNIHTNVLIKFFHLKNPLQKMTGYELVDE